MDLWFQEYQTKDLGLACRVVRTLAREKTQYQELLVVDTVQYGRLLALDGAIQLTTADEFVYHEMIAHVPMVTHKCPRKVLVIGGGDGGTVREVLKHPAVERVDLVEIDDRVLDICRRFFPETSSSLSDPRVRVTVGDGVEYVKKVHGEYDVAIVDSSDPVGPGVGLFAGEFYRDLFACLADDGLVCAQTESPFLNGDLIRSVYRSISETFPLAALYLAPIPTYPSGLWSFTIGSKIYNPLEPEGRASGLETRYYTPEIHRAAFVLPGFVQQLVSKGRGPAS
ncbi:MAG TPA: polyamine aminopropyltransferase [Firmicutes bacterium]|nr:polyamine aminopropyltransferase [Bacillota bacterium]